MKCKHCRKEVGEFYSELETHLWIDHRDIMMKFLDKHKMKEKVSE